MRCKITIFLKLVIWWDYNEVCLLENYIFYKLVIRLDYNETSLLEKIIYLKLVIRWDYSEAWYWQIWFNSVTYFLWWFFLWCFFMIIVMMFFMIAWVAWLLTIHDHTWKYFEIRQDFGPVMARFREKSWLSHVQKGSRFKRNRYRPTSNKPRTSKNRYHMHIDERVDGNNICIINWNVIVFCEIIILVVVVVVVYHHVVNFHH